MKKIRVNVCLTIEGVWSISLLIGDKTHTLPDLNIEAVIFIMRMVDTLNGMMKIPK
jgi:hypothetical protein